MISQSLIDVDFPAQPQFVFGDLGMSCMDDYMPQAMADVINLIPESEWRDLSQAIKEEGGGSSALVGPIKNQRNEGSCVGNAMTKAVEIVLAKQRSLSRAVILSAISLYKQIGSSPNSGAMVSNGIRKAAEVGILPLDTPKNREMFGDAVMPATGFYTAWPDNWKDTAKRFRATEWFICKSVNELCSALLLQYPVVVGRDGHSICYCDLVYDGDTLLVKYANSWGADWGENGFGYDSIGRIRKSASWAVALRDVVFEEI